MVVAPRSHSLGDSCITVSITFSEKWKVSHFYRIFLKDLGELISMN